MAFIAIHRAATYGDVDALRRELASGVSPDQVGPHGLVPLHFSAAHGAVWTPWAWELVAH